MISFKSSSKTLFYFYTHIWQTYISIREVNIILDAFCLHKHSQWRGVYLYWVISLYVFTFRIERISHFIRKRNLTILSEIALSVLFFLAEFSIFLTYFSFVIWELIFSFVIWGVTYTVLEILNIYQSNIFRYILLTFHIPFHYLSKKGHSTWRNNFYDIIWFVCFHSLHWYVYRVQSKFIFCCIFYYTADMPIMFLYKPNPS